jgi:hypothetical protein
MTCKCEFKVVSSFARKGVVCLMQSGQIIILCFVYHHHHHHHGGVVPMMIPDTIEPETCGAVLLPAARTVETARRKCAPTHARQTLHF